MRKLLLCACALLVCGAASGQQYPNRPLHYIVPFPPGAFNDALARTVAAELPKALGQPVLVENRPGGNTIIGTEAAAKSPADGYTLFGAALPFSVVQSLYKTSFDVTKDFAPITLAGVTPNLLVANPKVPVSTVAELLAYARANPGKLKAVAVSSKTRSALAPEVPTVDEAGVPGYDVTVWFGILTVAGTPRDIVQRLNTEIVKILTSSEVRERFGKAGVEVVAGTPEQFSVFLKSEVARWAKVVQDANIKAD